MAVSASPLSYCPPSTRSPSSGWTSRSFHPNSHSLLSTYCNLTGDACSRSRWPLCSLSAWRAWRVRWQDRSESSVKVFSSGHRGNVEEGVEIICAGVSMGTWTRPRPIVRSSETSCGEETHTSGLASQFRAGKG